MLTIENLVDQNDRYDKIKKSLLRNVSSISIDVKESIRYRHR